MASWWADFSVTDRAGTSPMDWISNEHKGQPPAFGAGVGKLPTGIIKHRSCPFWSAILFGCIMESPGLKVRRLAWASSLWKQAATSNTTLRPPTGHKRDTYFTVHWFCSKFCFRSKPYKSTPEAMQAVITGEVDLATLTV